MSLEIERKWLLQSPPQPIQLVRRGARVIRISQTYINLNQPGSHRVRKSIEGSQVTFEQVTKVKRAQGVNEETTRTLDQEEYESLLQASDPSRRSIDKTRFILPLGDLKLEIDVFKFPSGLVTAEVEFPSITAFERSVTLPSWLGPARDVTDQPGYSNAELARI